MNVTILTATLPERADMLAEAKASVAALEVPFDVTVEHIVLVDDKREGAGALLADGVQLAKGQWVMVLDDDDLLHPNHIEVVTKHCSDAVDVVYTLPEVTGGSFTNYEIPFDPAVLARRNIVSHNALMRLSLVRHVGSYRNLRMFDWDLFKRLEAGGADFLQIPETTWTYRLHGSNWSQGTLEGAMA